jgi:hypothetical protein
VDLDSNLVGLYETFYGTYVDLSRQGVPVVREANGGVWRYRHGRLVPYVRLFVSEVPAQRRALTRMLLSDGRAENRRAAAGLLGFDLTDPSTVTALTQALMDPDASVRTGAAHALLPKVRAATRRGEALVDVDVVVRMLKLPSHSDRAGASVLLAEMARLPHLRAAILQLAGPILRQMAAGTNPSTRNFARNLLSL